MSSVIKKLILTLLLNPHQVSANGYFSVGSAPQSNTFATLPEANLLPVIAPFAADIDTSNTGRVRYTQFTSTDTTQMSTVSSFIRDEADVSFNGVTMVIAEWREVPFSGGPMVRLGLHNI